MATRDEVRDALLELIVAEAQKLGSPTSGTHASLTLKLAEAYAWVCNPDQSHGGSSPDTSN